VGNVAALKPYAFRPGQSGNSGGRPKGRSLRTRLKALDKTAFEALRELLESPDKLAKAAGLKIFWELRAPTPELRAQLFSEQVEATVAFQRPPTAEELAELERVSEIASF